MGKLITNVPATVRVPCRICGNIKWCTVHKEKKYIICKKIPSGQVSKDGIGWVHPIDSAIRHKVIVPKVKENHTVQAPIANAKRRNKVYKELIQYNPLADHHYQDLIARGVDPSNYGTLRRKDGEGRTPWHGTDAFGVPGFAEDRRGKKYYSSYLAPNVYEALIVPNKDLDSNIVGCQLRIVLPNGDKKYIWLSSAKSRNGVGSGSPAHIAQPAQLLDSTTVYLTEGHFKAEAISREYGAVAIGLAGVSTYRNVADIIERLKPSKIVLAFDMDMLTNRHVLQALNNCIAFYEEYTIDIATWDSVYKGIDDALIAGVGIKFKRKHTSAYISLEHAQKAQGELAKRLLTHPDGKFHLFKSTVGAGKTTSVINTINDMLDNGTYPMKNSKKYVKMLILTDNHKLLEEIQGKLKFNPRILKGRDGEEGSNFFCAEYDATQKAGKAGHNIYKTICASCPIVDYCQYYASVRSIMEDNVVLSTKAAFFNSPDRLDNFDIVIIDESLHTWFFDEISVTVNDLHLAIEAIERKQKDYHKDHIRQLQQMIHIIEESKNHYNMFELLPTHLGQEEWITKYIPYIEQGFQREDGEWVYPKNFIEKLPEAKVFVKGHKIIISRLRTDLIDKLKSKTVINLDATPLNAMLSMVEPEVHEFRVKEHMNITQVTALKTSKSTLKRELNSSRVIKAVRALTAKHSSVAVIANKEFANTLADNGISADIGWYGKHTRGVNSFKNHEAIVIASDYIINTDQALIWSETAKLFGKAITRQEIIDQTRDAEITQAIGRGRSVLRNSSKKLEVYILTNSPISGLVINNYVARIENIYEGFVDNEEMKQQKLLKKSQKEDAIEIKNEYRKDGLEVPTNYVAMESVYQKPKRSVASDSLSLTGCVLDNLKNTVVIKGDNSTPATPQTRPKYSPSLQKDLGLPDDIFDHWKELFENRPWPSFKLQIAIEPIMEAWLDSPNRKSVDDYYRTLFRHGFFDEVEQ